MLGTTRALTAANESVTATFTDDAYGNTLAAPDPSATPHQYVGRLGYYVDADSGLQLLTQRYYDPTAGRFVSEDPARHHHEWYAYGHLQPARPPEPSAPAPGPGNPSGVPSGGRSLRATRPAGASSARVWSSRTTVMGIVVVVQSSPADV